MLDQSIRQELEFVAARFVLGQIQSSELVNFANSMLNRGVFSEGFAQMWNQSVVTMSDVAPSFHAALTELGVQCPSPASAKKHLLLAFLRDIVDQVVPPIEGLCSLKNWADKTFNADWGDAIDRSLVLIMKELVNEYWQWDQYEWLRQDKSISRENYEAELSLIERNVIEKAHHCLTTLSKRDAEHRENSENET